MDLLNNAKLIRLRSHHDKFLLAADDEETVCQDRNGMTRQARWTIEYSPTNGTILFLRSCYGLYLTASNLPFLLGVTGHKVLQTKPSRLDSSVQWEPVREGFQVKLKTRYGHYLRANGGLPPWRNSVTHDIPHRSVTQDWLLWDVDVLEVYAVNAVPDRCPVSQSSSFSEFYAVMDPKLMEEKSSSSLSETPRKPDGRTIRYCIADADGNVDESCDDNLNSFMFKGSCVEELKCRLEEETGLEHITVCTRSQLDGKLYPLRLHLPPNNAAFNVVVLQSTLAVAESFAN